jgi:H+-transporting ATPase
MSRRLARGPAPETFAKPIRSADKAAEGGFRRVLSSLTRNCHIEEYRKDIEKELGVKEKQKQEKAVEETAKPRRAPKMTGEERPPVSDSRQFEMRELIARRAYEIYEERGKCDGEDMNDWLKAEAELLSRTTQEARMAPEKRRAATPRARA